MALQVIMGLDGGYRVKPYMLVSNGMGHFSVELEEGNGTASVTFVSRDPEAFRAMGRELFALATAVELENHRKVMAEQWGRDPNERDAYHETNTR